MQFFPLVPSIAFSNKSIQQDHPNFVCTNGELQSIHRRYEEGNTSLNGPWALLYGGMLRATTIWSIRCHRVIALPPHGFVDH